MRYSFLLAFFIFFFNPSDGISQCKKFAKEVCKPKLEGFAHDGNYNGFVLSVGEEVELHKAFFSDQLYRIVVCQEEQLPPVHFKIMNSDLEILYDNKEDGYQNHHDFILEESSNLIISVKLLEEEFKEGDANRGCVAILFGIKL
eukprot:TRINITY_DN644_c1_g2_i1.p2 TRINITY_DN644_c1_g2~~TRINITY_DN644_c1_g2_i1.p2  ORF type:complete len:144 (-),score=16.04 TRINITY_DN644_c1_g2_i1:148-579(-)